MRELSRRQVLQIGAAAGLVAMFGRMPSAYASDSLAHLSRSTYTPHVGDTFTVDGAALNLTDAPGTEETFRLELAAISGVVKEGVRTFSHPALGSFELFVAPVGVAADGRYEVVVDRSIKLPGDVPGPPPPTPVVAGTAVAAHPGVPHKGVVRKLHHPKRRRHKRRRHAKTAS